MYKCHYDMYNYSSTQLVFSEMVYAVFIFTITIIFGSIVTAHFTSVYANTRKQAVVYVMLHKCAIMGKVDTLLSVSLRLGCHGNVDCCTEHSCKMQTEQSSVLDYL